MAEWAEVTLRTGALPDGPHNIVFHAVPSARGDVPHAYLETKKILQLREYATEKVMVPVRGGASLEICMQLLWLQNPSAVELTADVEFHSFGMRGMSKLVGRIFGGRSSGVRLGAALEKEREAIEDFRLEALHGIIMRVEGRCFPYVGIEARAQGPFDETPDFILFEVWKLWVPCFWLSSAR